MFLTEFTMENFGFTEFGQLAEIINDTIVIKDKNVFIQLKLDLSSDFGLFVQQTENHRRVRRSCGPDGGESSSLNIAAGPLA